MNKDTDIITAPLNQVADLLKQNYVCVSVIGKVYQDIPNKDQIERITNLNVFRLYYHIRSKDYFACYFLYWDILQKKGIDRLQKEIQQLLTKHNKTKIALCDNNNKDDEFGFRHILRYFLLENGVQVFDTENIDLSTQKHYWKQDRYKMQGHFNLTDEYVGVELEKCNWIFAKTMAKKNPHWYTLRKDFDKKEVFLRIIAHIRYNGLLEIFEGVLYRVFYWNGYKYWDHPCDELNEDVDLINRATL